MFCIIFPFNVLVINIIKILVFKKFAVLILNIQVVSEVTNSRDLYYLL